MPTYKYKVRDKFGKLITGVIGSDSKESAAKHLEKMGYAPIFISEQKELQFAKIFERFTRASREDLNLFTRQMSTLIKAGVPITTSLQSVEKQTKSRKLKRVIDELIKDIQAGNTFSETLTRHPQTFDTLYVNTVRAGEISGMMDEVLDRLASLGEYEADTIAKIKTATRYPLLAFCVLIIGFFFIVTIILPRFVNLFSILDTELPLITLILIKFNNMIQKYWFFALVIVGISIYVFSRFLKTDKGKYAWSKFQINVPIFGPLLHMLIMSRFARIMAIMVKSGVPIIEVLDTASRTIDNAVLSNAIIDVKDGVKEGKSIAEPMRISGAFSPIVLQMVSVGEETGKLDELLFMVSEYYDKQTDYMIKNLATLIEPIFITVLAAGVLVLALSVFLPMWNMFHAFTRG